MYKVKIKSTGQIIDIAKETDLLSCLRDNGVYIKSSCGGVANCTDCIYRVEGGEDNLNTPTFEELKLIGNVFHITKERLACQTQITGDVEIDLSMHNKENDEAVLLKKTKGLKKKSVQTKVRKKDEVEQVLSEREVKREERKTKQDVWFKHWEKGAEEKKRLGGGKRPKEFRTDNIEFGEKAEETAIAKEEGIKRSLEKKAKSAEIRSKREKNKDN